MPIGLLLSCAALLSVCAEGPERATLTGSVADPSHAVIPGARIELTNAETSEVTTALTDHQGRYTVSALRAGSYSVSIEAAGFDRFARAGVMLTSEETVRLNVTLEVAMAAELITVAAKRPDFDEALEVREVRESAAKDVGEALARVDGLWKIRKGGVANDVVLRAFQQNNINVIIDGARIYGACPNHMDPRCRTSISPRSSRWRSPRAPSTFATRGAWEVWLRSSAKRPLRDSASRPSLARARSGTGIRR